MERLENQIGEHEPTVRAPADWQTMQREYMARRRVTARDVIELAAIVLASAAMAMVI